MNADFTYKTFVLPNVSWLQRFKCVLEQTEEEPRMKLITYDLDISTTDQRN